MENREVVTSRDESFSPSDPLLLHWNAKLLTTAMWVAAIGRGTGEEQANACLSTLDDWQLREQCGTCF